MVKHGSRNGRGGASHGVERCNSVIQRFIDSEWLELDLRRDKPLGRVLDFVFSTC